MHGSVKNGLIGIFSCVLYATKVCLFLG
jgi:hypothetical protein